MGVISEGLGEEGWSGGSDVRAVFLADVSIKVMYVVLACAGGTGNAV
jgi:hypothetical protein